MNKFGKNTLTALAAVFGFIALSAQGCEGAQPKGLILAIDGPPLAQTLGCPEGKWFLRVLANEIAENPQLTTDEKVAKAQRLCLDEGTARKYVVEGQYP